MAAINRNYINNNQHYESKAVLMLSTLSIFPFAPVHGTPVIAYTIRAYLAAGWKIYFLTSFKPRPADRELINQIITSSFGGSALNTLQRVGNRLRKIGFFIRAFWWAIVQILFLLKACLIINKNKISLIYTWDVYAAPAGWLLSKLFGIPWVARYLGTFLFAEMKNVAWKFRSWEQVIAYKLSGDMIIITDDGTLGDVVLDKLKVDKNKIKYWMNGINKQAFLTLPSKDDMKKKLNIKNKFVLLAASRLNYWKRVDRIISAIPGVISKVPDTILLVVGDGPERFRLEKLAQNIGVARNVRFVGAVRHEEITSYYAVADIFLSMYDISNVGNPLLEAMLAGKCCLVLDVGGTAKILNHGKTGLLIKKENLATLSEAIVSLLMDEPLREWLGKNAREWAWQNLKSWDERFRQELLEIENIILNRSLYH